MQPASSASLEAQWPDLVAAVSAAIDLEATARTSEALVRRREIRSAEALLRLALAYGPGGLSLRTAAAWAGVSGLADLSDTAVMNRLRKAAGWLGEIAGALLRRAAAASTALDGPLPGRRLRIADGSMVTRPGGRSKRRLHRSRPHRRARRRGLRAHPLADGRRGARRPLLRPPSGAAAALGGRGRLHRQDRLDQAAAARRGPGAAGVGADLRRPGGRRGGRAGGLGRPLRQGRQVARRRRVPGAPHRPPPP